MATKLPRLNVVLEKPLYAELRNAAQREGLSASAKARDLIREALEIEEDLHFSALAEERLKGSRGKTLTHDQVWGSKKH